MLYGTLAQTNPGYDAKLWDRIRLLYRGGWEIAGRAREVLKKAPNETTKAYEYRLSLASYVGYFGHVTNYLAGALFWEPVSVVPNSESSIPDEEFYEEFSRNADRRETSFSSLMKLACVEALLVKTAWLAVDLPPGTESEVASRADEDALGLRRAYCYLEPAENVLDWEEDDDGRLTLVVIKRRITKRTAIEQARGGYRDEFRVWELTESGARFSLYRSRDYKADETPDAKDALTLVEQRPTSFNVLPYARLTLPDGLWVGNQVGPLALEHFKRRSDLAGSVSSSLVEIPVVSLAPEIGGMGEAMPSELAQDPHRGDDPIAQHKARGYMVLGEHDRFEFVGPKGAVHQAARDELSDLRDEIYRTVTAMALALNQTGAAVGRSGQSKREDRIATEIVLEAIAHEVKKAAICVYRLIADAREETDVEWEAHGVENFNLAATGESVTEAIDVIDIDIPSKTFKSKYLSQLAIGLVRNLDPETQATIRDEIEKGVEEQGHAADALAAMTAQLPTGEDDDNGPPSSKPAGAGRTPPGANPPGIPRGNRGGDAAGAVRGPSRGRP